MGFKFAALMEGIRPNTIPISMENATEIRIAGTLIPTLVSDILEMACAIIIPVNTPMIPPGAGQYHCLQQKLSQNAALLGTNGLFQSNPH